MTSQLRVRIFASLEVEGLEAAALGSRKQRTLLRLLAIGRGHPVATDLLADRLWPEQLPSRPADQVSVLVSRLRGVLGTDRISRNDAGYALRADWIDLVGFEQLLGQADRSLSDGQAATAATAAGAALALARGALLADEPTAEWAETERRAAERDVNRLRLISAEATLLTGDPFRAAAAAEVALAADPYDEEALRLLMTAQARAGRPAHALAVFARTRDHLLEELGANPSAATEELHVRILREEIEPLRPPRSDGPDAVSTAAPSSGRLPGRSEAWGELDRARGDSQGALVMVHVEGEAGIGKTRLLRDWIASQRDQLVLSGSCRAAGQIALQPVLDALDDFMVQLDPEATETWLERAGPILGPLLIGQRGQGPTADPLTGRSALLTAITKLLASTTPAILVLDDLHLADVATREWLDHLGARAASLTGLLVVTASQPGGRPSTASVRDIALGPLDIVATAEVVGRDRAEDLHLRSAGNPLFLVELAAMDDPTVIPSGIVDAVATRAAGLGPARETLVTAAVLGSDIDLDVLAGVLRRPAVALLRDLELGQDTFFLEVRGTAFSFRHELVRQALAESAPSPRRALANRDAARILAGRPSAEPLVVADHARRGGDVVLAAQALADAAGLAQIRFDYQQAEGFLDEALELDPTAPWHIARGQVRLTREDFAGAMEDARAAMAPESSIDALELGSWAAYYQRDFDTARRLCAVAAASGGADRMAALTGRIAHADGDLASAVTRLETAGSAGVGAVWLGWLVADEGDVDRATRLAMASEHDPTLKSHPFAEAHRCLLAAYALGLKGQTAAAMELLDKVDDEVERRHLEHFGGRTLNYRAWLFRNLLDSPRADAMNEEALGLAAARNLREATAQGHLDLADAALRAGDPDEAARALARSRDQGTGYAFFWKADARRILLEARRHLVLDRPESALELLRTKSQRPASRRHVMLATLLEALAAARAGEPQDTTELGHAIEELGRFALPEAWLVTAELAQALRVDAWWETAGIYATRLAEGAGQLGPSFMTHAGTVLESMRSERRRR